MMKANIVKLVRRIQIAKISNDLAEIARSGSELGGCCAPRGA